MEAAGEAGESLIQQCSNCDSCSARCWCLDCNEAMCDDCVSAHRRVTVTRSHRLINQLPQDQIHGDLSWTEPGHLQLPSGNIWSSPTKFCRLHPSEPLQLFCFTCSLLTCRDCQLMAHMNHRFQFASEAQATLKRQLEACALPIRAQRDAVRRSLRDMSNRLTQIDRSNTHLKTQLQKIYLILAQLLRMRVENMVKEIEKVHELECERINQRMVKLKQLQQTHTSLTETAEKARNTSDLSTLLTYTTQMKSQLKDLLLQDFCPPPTMAHLKVITNKKTLETISHFGDLSVSWVPFNVPQTSSENIEAPPPPSAASSTPAGIAPIPLYRPRLQPLTTNHITSPVPDTMFQKSNLSPSPLSANPSSAFHGPTCRPSPPTATCSDADSPVGVPVSSGSSSDFPPSSSSQLWELHFRQKLKRRRKEVSSSSWPTCSSTSYSSGSTSSSITPTCSMSSSILQMMISSNAVSPQVKNLPPSSSDFIKFSSSVSPPTCLPPTCPPPTYSSPTLPPPTLLPPTLPSPTLPSPTLPSPTLPPPTLLSPTLPPPTCPSPTLPPPTRPSPTLPSPTLPSPTFPPPTLPPPTLPSPTLPSPTLPSPTLPPPTLLSPTLPPPTCPSPTLPPPTLPSPTCPSPTLPPPTLPSPTLPPPTLAPPTLVPPTLPSPTLPSPTLPSPTLPSPTLPSPTLPPPTCPSPTLPRPTLPPPTCPPPTRPSPTLPSPTVPPPTLPSPTCPPLTCPPPTRPPPTLPPPTCPSPTLPPPTCPSPTRPSPTVPPPTLPSPTLPSPTCPPPTLPRPTLPPPTCPPPTCPPPTLPSPTCPPPTLPPPICPPPTCPSPTCPSPTRPSPILPPPTYLAITCPPPTCLAITCPPPTRPPPTCSAPAYWLNTTRASTVQFVQSVSSVITLPPTVSSTVLKSAQRVLVVNQQAPPVLLTENLLSLPSVVPQFPMMLSDNGLCTALTVQKKTGLQNKGSRNQKVLPQPAVGHQSDRHHISPQQSPVVTDQVREEPAEKLAAPETSDGDAELSLPETCDGESEESSHVIEQLVRGLRQWQPTVPLVRLPVSLPRPGCPLPIFRLVRSFGEDEVYVQELNKDSEIESDDDTVDFTEPLSSPESPAFLEILSCAACGSASTSIICSSCGRGYHRHCHVPPVGLDIRSEWLCSLCQDLSDPLDPYSTDRLSSAQMSSLSLQNLRRCESLLLHLKVEGCSRLSESCWSRLQWISERLSCGQLPSYQTAAQVVSDIWPMFEASQDHALDQLQQSFQKKLEETLSSELHPSVLKAPNSRPADDSLSGDSTKDKTMDKDKDEQMLTSKLSQIRKRLRDLLDVKNPPRTKRTKME
uniref:B box-type domain-containing protein n=1 Tax=Amphiprion ocellaris TaxID=80972 RepID=A0AAQ5ZJ20_AMPOC